MPWRRGTTTRVPRHGLGDRRQRTRSRGGLPAASPGGLYLDTKETAGSPTKRSGGRNNAITEATSRIHFILPLIIVLALITYVPGLCLWLPRLVLGTG